MGEFELLEQIGLNTSQSRVAARCCKYEKFEERGLFLNEHRRCYDEIIGYCNKLVYKEKLQPMRGKGTDDKGRAIKHWPQMGFKQIFQGAERNIIILSTVYGNWSRPHIVDIEKNT